MHERVITVSWTTRNVSFGPRVVFQKFFDEPWACGEGKRELIESAREFPKDFRPASPGGVAPEVRRRIAAQVTPYVSKCFKLRGCYTRNASGEFYYSSNVRNRAAYRDRVTPTRSQYFTSLHRLQNGETGWQIFWP